MLGKFTTVTTTNKSERKKEGKKKKKKIKTTFLCVLSGSWADGERTYLDKSSFKDQLCT